MIKAKEFIEKYERYYFKEKYEKNDTLGIKGLKSTIKENEKVIVDKLKNGEHDECVIAWKLGGYIQKVNPKSIRGSYGTFNVSSYLEESRESREDILKYINSALKNLKADKSFFCSISDLVKAFDLLNKCEKPDKFGTVYLINSMFFLSKGEIPIYDKNVYKAIQALYLNKNPKDIIVSDAPSSKDRLGAMFRLLEYMWLHEKVFGKDKTTKSEQFRECEHVGYISRGLDRALWVYGQCTQKYQSEDS